MRLNATRGIPQIERDKDNDPFGNGYRHAIKRDAQFVVQRTLEELNCIGNYVEVDVLFGGAIQIDARAGTCTLGRFEHQFRYRSGRIVASSPEKTPETESLTELYHILFHEVAHAARYFSPSFTPYRKTATQFMIDEGIAEVFASERTYNPISITEEVEVATNGLINVIRNDKDIPLSWLRRNDPAGPYRFCASLIIRSMEMSGRDIDSMIPMQYEDIVETFRV
jgi:hypothetical protein